MLTDYANLLADMPDSYGLVPLAPAERVVAVKRMNMHLPAFPLNPDSTIARSGALSFYPTYRLVSLTDLATLPPYEIAGLMRPRDALLLDGSLDPVLEANKRDGLRLMRETALDYIRFLFLILRTDGEALTLSADTPPTLRPIAAPGASISVDVQFVSGLELAAARLDLDRDGKPTFSEARVVGPAPQIVQDS